MSLMPFNCIDLGGSRQDDSRITSLGVIRWCPKVALIQLTEGFGLTKKDRLIYEEIARVRYLVGNGFRLLLGSDEKTVATWKKITAQVDQRSEKIADDLLSRRQ